MTFPSFSFEKKLWKRYEFVAGVDEVGRGCFAGPVVAGCVIFAKSASQGDPLRAVRIDDSKKLRPRQREKSSKWIKKNSLSWGVGEAPASLINRIGMAKATKVAFRRAISSARRRLGKPIDYLLIDAFYVSNVAGLPAKGKRRQLAIVNGDEKSISIAGASIIAKVYRDKFMQKLSRKYRKYGWSRNKGYGTAEHQKAIKKYGINRYHRKQFIQTFLQKEI